MNLNVSIFKTADTEEVTSVRFVQGHRIFGSMRSHDTVFNQKPRQQWEQFKPGLMTREARDHIMCKSQVISSFTYICGCPPFCMLEKLSNLKETPDVYLYLKVIHIFMVFFPCISPCGANLTLTQHNLKYT